MNIIIAGAGNVGFYLARALSIGHNITMIDRNPDALNRLQESLDIFPVYGDIEDPATYEKLSTHEADLFIAVADTDETNLIATLIADEAIEVGRKFIRLKNRYFAKTAIREKLGVTEAVFPLKLTSETVAMLLDYPKANNVKRFVHTDFKLISVHVSATVEPTVLDEKGFVVVGIERAKRFFIPKEHPEIRAGDLIYLFGSETAIGKLCDIFETKVTPRIERCVVFGADELGVTVAQTLIERGRKVKLIERDMQLCERADEQLAGRAVTINCSYGMADIFEEESLAEADMVIAATDDDEYNIIKCLEAKEYGIERVVAVNNEPEYYSLMHALGIIVVRGPKISAYNTLVEKIDSNRVVLFRSFCGGKAAIFMRRIFAGSKWIGRLPPMPKRRTDERILLVRGGTLLDFECAGGLEEGDLITLFCSEASQENARAWINGF